MLALDQTNEEKMKKISSIQQEADVQNMAVIAWSGHRRRKQEDQFILD